MPKKFDTNPLDPEFPEKAKAKAAAAETAPQAAYGAPTGTQRSRFSTAEFPAAPSSITEEETRRFGDADFQAYWQAGGIQTSGLYSAPTAAPMFQTPERKVARTGISEKWLIALPYLPFSIGLVAGIIELLLIQKDEAKVRFHAAQGLAAHIGILIVTTILGILGNVTGLADLGYGIFTLVTTIMLIIFTIKAWKGKPVHIESVEDLTNWLEEKIGPVK